MENYSKEKTRWDNAIDIDNGKWSIQTSKKFVFKPSVGKNNILKSEWILSYTDCKANEYINWNGIIKLEAILDSRKQKNLVRIKSIHWMNEKINKDSNITRLWKIMPYLNDLLYNINIDFNERLYNLKEFENSLVFELNDKPREKKRTVITLNEWSALIKNEHDLEIQSFLFYEIALNRLESFEKKLREKIEITNEKEATFQNLFEEYADVLFLIFDVDFQEDFNGEKQLIVNGTKKNKTDIKLGEHFIIELKKPGSRLFCEKYSRNNICGISDEFASALNQLNYYLVKSNYEKGLAEEKLIKGALIIGRRSLINSKDKKISWKYFNEPHKFQVLTYDDVCEKVKRMIAALSKISKGIKKRKAK